MPNDYTLNVTAKLNSQNLADQIKSVGQSTTLTISKIKLDGAEISGTISKALQDGMSDIKLGGSATSNLVKEAKSAGTTAGQEISSSVEKQMAKLSFSENFQKQFSQISTALGKLDFTPLDQGLRKSGETSESVIEKIVQGLGKVQDSTQQTNVMLTGMTSNLKQNGNMDLTVTGLDDANNAITMLIKYNEESHEFEVANTKIAAAFNNTSRALSDTGTSAANMNKEYRELVSVAKELSNMKLQEVKLSFEPNSEQQLETINQQIEQLEARYNELNATFTNAHPEYDMTSLEDALRRSDEAIQNYKASVQDAINMEFDTGKIANSFDNISTKFSDLSEESKITVTSFTELEAAYSALEASMTSNDVEQIAKAYNDYCTALQKTTNEVQIAARADKEAANAQKESEKAAKEATKAQKELADAEKLAANASKLSNDISTWMSNNTKAADQFKDELTDLQTRLQNVGSTADLSAISAEFRNIQAEAKSAGMATSSFAQELGHAVLQAVGLGTTMQAVSKAISMIKSGIEIVKDLDAAMAQLQIVTGATESEMNQFLEQSISLAKELGQSVDDILDSITVFSRLGYDLEDASELTEYASILSNVAGVELSEGTEGLTSVIKGFGMSVDEAEHIADVLVTVGNNYAVSASEILEAMEKSSAAFNATGTSFEEASAIIAAGNAAVQDASTVGTAMKTVSARIRGATTELEELGEDSEEIAAGFSKYANELEMLTGFSILEEGTTDTYKDIYEIFDGIAAVWDQLSDTTQSRVSEILGGTRQLQVISSIMANWDDAVDAYAQSMDSAGVAIEANAIYMETLEAKTAQFSASVQELASDFFQSDFIKSIVDFGTQAINVIDKMVDSFGSLGSVMIAIGGGTAIKGLAWPKIIGDKAEVNADKNIS